MHEGKEMYVEFKEVGFTLPKDEQVLLLDALACLIDAYHWAGQSESDKGQQVMDMYQKFVGYILGDDDFESKEDTAD